MRSRTRQLDDSVDILIRQLKGNIKKNKERLITATRKNKNNTSIKRKTINRKQKWEEKHLYGYSSDNKQNLPRENLDMATKGKL